MSATGSGLTQISNVNLAAGGAAGSQINFTHNLGVRAVQVYCSDAVTGRQLDGTEISVAQPTANVVQVANVTTGAVVGNVSIRFQYDSVEENAVLSTDSRIVAAVGPPPVAAGIVGGGAANQVTYWTGAAAISGNAFLTTDPATGDLDRIKNVPYDWPAANAVGVLTNDGAGNLTWAPAGAAGANTALSNLAAVAVNLHLLWKRKLSCKKYGVPFLACSVWIHRCRRTAAHPKRRYLKESKSPCQPVAAKVARSIAST